MAAARLRARCDHPHRRRARCGWSTRSRSRSGIAAAFDAPARQAFVSELVPHAVPQQRGRAELGVVQRAPGCIGPAVAGLLVAAVGVGWVFLINAVTFGAVLLSLVAAAHRPSSPRSRRPPRARGQLLERAPLRARPPRHPAGAHDDRDPRHDRLQLPDLHLGDGAHRVPRGRRRVRRAVIGHRDRLGDRRPARRRGASARGCGSSRSPPPGSARASPPPRSCPTP